MLGGLALKNTFTRRYERQEFEDIKVEIFDMLSDHFNLYDVPRFFHNKETFGDIDIIIGTQMKGEYIRSVIENVFKPNEIFHNGSSWSFDYKEIQVDFIICQPDDFNSNFHYLAFNDLGNFIGRLAQSIGFKYGQEGLWYNHYSEYNTKTKIIVSKDYPEIFDFLALDYSKWETGFDTLEEIFDYAMTSSLFNPKMFQLSQLNKINRERNLKRKSYMSFLDYIEDKPAHKEYDEDIIALAKPNIIEMIRRNFPDANIDYHLAQINYESAKKTLVHSKFNGNIVKEKYGLEGKELGEAMKRFNKHIKSYLGEHYPFDDYILNTDLEAIYMEFESILK